MEIKSFLDDLKIQVLSEEGEKELSSFKFINLPSDFAITLGNYLRRILLSYISGVAILGIKVGNGKETVKSEFIPLKGLVETLPYLILNLKKLVIKSKRDNPNSDSVFKLNIEIENDSDSEYEVKGKDIKSSEGLFEILNPDIYLATVSPRSKLEIEMYCKSSWGFKKESAQSVIDKEEDVIIIDSNYSPVKNVSYKIDLVVVDLDKQEERLVLNITTDGSITPKEALINALKISETINKSLINKMLTQS